MTFKGFAISVLILTLNSPLFAKDAKYAPNHWTKEEYLLNSQLQAGWADQFFFKQYTFNGTENVLDIGSGDGKLSARIATALPNGKVMGIDKSKDMIEKATQNFKDKPNLVFMLEDADNANFYQQHPNEFDLVVSFTTFHWLKDQDAALAGIEKVLKPKGTFYLKLCSKTFDPIQAIADSLMANPKYQAHFKGFIDPISRYSIKEYESLLNKANLEVLSIKDSDEKDKIANRDSLIKQIKSWLPHYHFLKKQNPKLAETYINEVIDTYIKKYPANPDGTITLYDHYLEVVGKKP